MIIRLPATREKGNGTGQRIGRLSELPKSDTRKPTPFKGFESLRWIAYILSPGAGSVVIYRIIWHFSGERGL